MPPKSAHTIPRLAAPCPIKVKAAYRRACAEAAAEKTARCGSNAVDFSLPMIRKVARGDGRARDQRRHATDHKKQIRIKDTF
jgi:hypothetical protein